LKRKLKGLSFVSFEVIEAESLAALNILWEHDFRNVFKNSRSSESGAWARKGTASRVMVASRPKIIFDHIARVPEIVDGSLYMLCTL
jgi:hypothetical protein